MKDEQPSGLESSQELREGWKLPESGEWKRKPTREWNVSEKTAGRIYLTLSFIAAFPCCLPFMFPIIPGVFAVLSPLVGLFLGSFAYGINRSGLSFLSIVLNVIAIGIGCVCVYAQLLACIP